MSNVLAFVLGMFTSWYTVLLLVVVIALLSGFGRTIVASLLTVFLAFVMYYNYNLTIQQMAIGFVCYVLVGLVWSTIRFSYKIKTLVSVYIARNQEVPESVIIRCSPLYEDNRSDITMWISTWPVDLAINGWNILGTYIFAHVSNIFVRVAQHRVHTLIKAADIEVSNKTDDILKYGYRREK